MQTDAVLALGHGLPARRLLGLNRPPTGCGGRPDRQPVVGRSLERLRARETTQPVGRTRRPTGPRTGDAGQYGAGMDWLTAIALPVGGIIGGLVGAWWSRRASKTAEVGTLLNAQLEALYSEHPRQRQAARDIIRGLMEHGSLTPSSWQRRARR